MEKPPLEVLYTSIAFLAWISREIQNYLDHKDVSMATILARGFVAGFSGYMFAQTIAIYDPALAMVASWLGGWMWPWAMQFIAFMFNKHFGYEKK
jgi:hypothetical protein